MRERKRSAAGGHVSRLSISLDSELLRRFDAKIRAENCPTRSKALADLIRRSLVEDEWQSGHEVAGAIVLVYDPHKRDLMRRLTEAQHASHQVIVSTQHIHLDHDNCLEIIAVRGAPAEIRAIFQRLKALKGMKHVGLAAATTGQQLA